MMNNCKIERKEMQSVQGESYSSNTEKEAQESEENQTKMDRNSLIKEKEGKHWTLEENLSLIFFVDYFKKIFCYHKKGKRANTFDKLAKVLPGRTTTQCRSRYQKLLKMHKTFSTIKRTFLLKNQVLDYEEKFEKFITTLESLPNFVPVKRIKFGRPKRNLEHIEPQQKQDKGENQGNEGNPLNYGWGQQFLPFPTQNYAFFTLYPEMYCYQQVPCLQRPNILETPVKLQAPQKL